MNHSLKPKLLQNPTLFPDFVTKVILILLVFQTLVWFRNHLLARTLVNSKDTQMRNMAFS